MKDGQDRLVAHIAMTFRQFAEVYERNIQTGKAYFTVDGQPITSPYELFAAYRKDNAALVRRPGETKLRRVGGR